MNKNICLLLSFVALALLSCNGDSKAGETPTSGGTNASDSTRQQIEPLGFQDPFLNRYEGVIDGKLEFEMVLVNDGYGHLQGWYQYAKIRKRIALTGEVNLDESITLEEFTDGRTTGKFEGDGTKISQIKGKWLSSTDNRAFDFEMSAVKSPDDEESWTGCWYLNDVWDGGTLLIGNVKKDSMDFSLSIVRNGHIGELMGRASRKKNKGKYKMAMIGEEEPCELIFIHRQGYIQLEQKSSPWACEFGMRAYAGGRYDAQTKVLEATIPFGEEEFFKTEAAHNAFKKWVGAEIYSLFAFNMQHSNLEEQEDGSQRILNGWVYGLGNANKSILVQRANGDLYAATPEYRDGEQSFLHYFSSIAQTLDTMIAPIKIWSEGFDNYKVVYHYPNKE